CSGSRFLWLLALASAGSAASSLLAALPSAALPGPVRQRHILQHLPQLGVTGLRVTEAQVGRQTEVEQIHLLRQITKHPPQIPLPDRKSTRLNSSHVKSSYAVFCLKNTPHPT